jgi:hypothetical protein
LKKLKRAEEPKGSASAPDTGANPATGTLTRSTSRGFHRPRNDFWTAANDCRLELGTLKGEIMNVLDQKKLLIERIVPYLTGAPGDVVQRLLQQSVSDLEAILEDAITKKARAQAAEHVKQHTDEIRRESRLEGSFVHACMALVNNRRLSTCDGNRAMLEGLLNPGEEPSAKLYVALAEQYPTKFAWETPSAPVSKQDQHAAFELFVREHNLSSVDANFNLFKQGATVEHFASASRIERAQYANEQARARQKFLINSASPQQLKQEAAWESQQNRAAAQREEADRAHKFASQAQAGLYSPLPTHNQAGELMDSKYFRRLSTVDFAVFKVAVKKWGTAQITERLRTPAV